MKTLKVALLRHHGRRRRRRRRRCHLRDRRQQQPRPERAGRQGPSAAKHAGARRPGARGPGCLPVPTCLPNLPKGKALDEAKASSSSEIKALAAKAPQTPVALPAAADGKLPDRQAARPTSSRELPTGKLPTGKLPKVPVTAAAELAKLPVGKLPTCNAAGRRVPRAVPKAPGLPSCRPTPALPCSKCRR